MDKSLEGSLALFDLGAVVNTICLLALEYGLGTCIHGQGSMYPEVIRMHTGLLENKKIVICVSLGYPDGEFPANRLESSREPAENITAWHGFED
jgi:nitroreductase